jgi:ATP adenylyltransferase
MALTTCMHEMNGLGFYNSGIVAGASQPHKHLQLVPLPLARTSHQLSTATDEAHHLAGLATKPAQKCGLGHGPRPTPLDSVLDCSIEKGTITRVPTLPFVHSMITLDGSRLGGHRAAELHQLYRHACAAVGVHDETQPYNLLLTRRWMLVIPRSREDWRGMSINALGFAGSLLVRNRGELDQLKEEGPLAVLKSVVDDHPAS